MADGSGEETEGKLLTAVNRAVCAWSTLRYTIVTGFLSMSRRPNERVHATNWQSRVWWSVLCLHSGIYAVEAFVSRWAVKCERSIRAWTMAWHLPSHHIRRPSPDAWLLNSTAGRQTLVRQYARFPRLRAYGEKTRSMPSFCCQCLGSPRVFSAVSLAARLGYPWVFSNTVTVLPWHQAVCVSCGRGLALGPWELGWTPPW